MAEYIEREAVNALIEAECSPKVAAFLNHAIDNIPAADAIEELVRKEKFHAFLWNTIQPNEMEAYISMYNAGNEKVETK